MRLIFPAVALSLAAACGQTSHNIHVYDAAPAGVTAVRISIEAVEAHVDEDLKKENGHDPADDAIDNDGKWRRLLVDRTLDLLEYESEEDTADLGELGMPEGKVTQIRLILDLDDEQVVTFEGSDCPLDTSAVDARGVKINHVFKAFDTWDGNHQDIYVHFDLQRSLTRTTDCFALEPHLQLTKVRVDGTERQL